MADVDLTPEIVSGELEPYQPPPPPANLFGTDDPVEVVVKATAVADALKDVIQRKGLFVLIQGKQHVQVEGWQLVGAMLGVTAVCTHTEPVDGGFKATVEARTVDGRVIGSADALCTKHEKRGPWKNADDYARLSMAQTRATSKALKGPLGFVISLAGYQTTPAEEMTFAVPDEPEPSPTRANGGKPSEVFIGTAVHAELVKGFEVSGVSPADLKMKLAAIGAQAAQTKQGVKSALACVTPEQAEQLGAWFSEKADQVPA